MKEKKETYLQVRLTTAEKTEIVDRSKRDGYKNISQWVLRKIIPNKEKTDNEL